MYNGCCIGRDCLFPVSKGPARRLRKSRPLRKQHVLKSTLQNSNTITDPEEDQKERNEGDAQGGYANKSI